MRIGTWNLDGHWTSDHARLMAEQDCDVWLLTELSDKAVLSDYQFVRTRVPMAQGRAWAAVASRLHMTAVQEPHPASAAARVGGDVYCSSVLPWRSCGSAAPWTDGNHAAKTRAAVDELMTGLPAGPLVWGGDWNNALDGPEVAGSAGGRAAVLDAVASRDLQVPTADLPHRLPGKSIDHVAVPAGWTATGRHVPTPHLSDHDAYVVEVAST